MSSHDNIDNTFFLMKSRKNPLIIQIHVDDIIFGATNESLCKEFAKLMRSEFEISLMGEINFFLGLQVIKTENGTSTKVRQKTSQKV